MPLSKVRHSRSGCQMKQHVLLQIMDHNSEIESQMFVLMFLNEQRGI